MWCVFLTICVVICRPSLWLAGAGSRDGGDGGQSGAAARLLSTLLTEMDGLELATGLLLHMVLLMPELALHHM